MFTLRRFLPGRLMLAAASACWLGGTALHAGADRVVKVLPHYLDTAGRHALSPSLFERDAYQALLRAHPERRGGLRFDVQWKARRAPGQSRRLRLELVSESHPRGRPLVREITLPEKRTRGWAVIKLDATAERALGEWRAWRVSLLVGEQVASEQHSFLW